jgi:formylglycine-generating enzyme required for sulfatase activity
MKFFTLFGRTFALAVSVVVLAIGGLVADEIDDFMVGVMEGLGTDGRKNLINCNMLSVPLSYDMGLIGLRIIKEQGGESRMRSLYNNSPCRPLHNQIRNMVGEKNYTVWMNRVKEGMMSELGGSSSKYNPLGVDKEEAKKLREEQVEKAKVEAAAENAKREEEERTKAKAAEEERMKQVKPQIEEFLKQHFVLVNGGTFQMGCSKGDKECVKDENPAHKVTVSDFYIGKYEVTQKLWVLVMGSNPLIPIDNAVKLMLESITDELDHNKSETKDFKEMLKASFEEKIKPGLPKSIGDALPMIIVSYSDVQTFIQKLNSITGKKYRLPTEAEWEYAARGGVNNKRYLYSGSKKVSDVAWYKDNSNGKTNPVGTKAPNEFGIYDMSGNVGEWVGDWYGDYGSDAQTNPTGPSTGSLRVNRGGSWYSEGKFCRVSTRGGGKPSLRSNDLGFRLVVSP